MSTSIIPHQLQPGEVRVSFFDAEAHGGLDATMWAQLVGWLQPDERERLNRFKNLESRASFLIGRGMVRRLLADITDVPPPAWRFVEGVRGRPEIGEPATRLRFNLAHSGGMVACVMADDRDVGIDVEHLDRRQLSFDVAARSCAPDEIDDINAEPAEGRQQRFLAYWTLKEAYLKARSLGISVHLPDVSFVLDVERPALVLRGSMADADPRWLMRIVQASSRHLLAVAAHHPEGDEPKIGFRRFRPEFFQAP